MTPVVVDPPSGWMYGFPRVYDRIKDGKLSDFYLRHGYPKEDIEFACKYTRSWFDDDTA
jgi:hypothetical protein